MSGKTDRAGGEGSGVEGHGSDPVGDGLCVTSEWKVTNGVAWRWWGAGRVESGGQEESRADRQSDGGNRTAVRVPAEVASYKDRVFHEPSVPGSVQPEAPPPMAEGTDTFQGKDFHSCEFDT